MAQLPSQSQFGDYGEWPGRDVLDSGGERLGGVREIYLDRETGRPEWVLVDIDGDEARFVPLADASVESRTIRVAHSAEAIRRAPGIGAESRIDQAEERRLYDHYGLGYSEADSASGLPAEEPPEPESSWSAAAGEEPTNLSPPPVEPPTPEELAAADIPEPPAATERASEDVALPPRGTTDEPVTAPRNAETELTAQHGPDAVKVFTPPPPAPEQPQAGGTSRKAGIAAGVGIAALLFVIVRKLR